MQTLGLHNPLGRLTPLGKAHQMMRLSAPLGHFTPSTDPSSSTQKPFQSLGQILQASFLETSLPYRDIATTLPPTFEPTVSAQLVDLPLFDQPNNLESTESEGNAPISNLEPLVQPKLLSTQKPLAQNADFFISPFTELSDNSDTSPASAFPARSQDAAIPERIRTEVQAQIQAQIEQESLSEQPRPRSLAASSALPPDDSSQSPIQTPKHASSLDEIATPSLSVSEDATPELTQLPDVAGETQTNLDIQAQFQDRAASTIVPTQTGLEAEPANGNAEALPSLPHLGEAIQFDTGAQTTDGSPASTTEPLTPASVDPQNLIPEISELPEAVSSSPPISSEPLSISSDVVQPQLNFHTPSAERQTAAPAPSLTQLPTLQQTDLQQADSITETDLPDTETASPQLQLLELPSQPPIPTTSSPPLQPQAELSSQQIEPSSQSTESSRQAVSTDQLSLLHAEVPQEQETIPSNQESQPRTVEQSEPSAVQRRTETATDVEVLEAIDAPTQQLIDLNLNDEAIVPISPSIASEVESREKFSVADTSAPHIELKSEKPPQAPIEHPPESVVSESVEPLSSTPSSVEPSVPVIHQTQQPVQAKLEPATSQSEPLTTLSLTPSPALQINKATDSSEQESKQARLDIPQLPQNPPLGLQKPLAAAPDLFRTILSDQTSSALTTESPRSATTAISLPPTASIETSAVKGDAPSTWSSLADLLGESSTVNRHSEPWKEQFGLKTAVAEERISPRFDNSSQPSTEENTTQQYTLTSPQANSDTATSGQAIGLQSSAPIDEEQMELLAQTIYRLMRDRFTLAREQMHHNVAGHAHWLDIFSYSNFQTSNHSMSSSPSLTQQAALVHYPTEQNLEALIQEIEQLLQLRLEIERERHGYCYP